LLLQGFKESRDQNLLFDARITISTQKNIEFAASQ